MDFSLIHATAGATPALLNYLVPPATAAPRTQGVTLNCSLVITGIIGQTLRNNMLSTGDSRQVYRWNGNSCLHGFSEDVTAKRLMTRLFSASADTYSGVRLAGTSPWPSAMCHRLTWPRRLLTNALWGSEHHVHVRAGRRCARS